MQEQSFDSLSWPGLKVIQYEARKTDFSMSVVGLDPTYAEGDNGQRVINDLAKCPIERKAQ